MVMKIRLTLGLASRIGPKRVPRPLADMRFVSVYFSVSVRRSRIR